MKGMRFPSTATLLLALATCGQATDVGEYERLQAEAERNAHEQASGTGTASSEPSNATDDGAAE